MIPLDIKKDIRRLPGAGIRILVYLLILGIAIIGSAYYKTTKARLDECEEHSNRQQIDIEKQQGETVKLRLEIDSLKLQTQIKTDEEVKQLKIRVAWQDSIKQALQHIIDRHR